MQPWITRRVKSITTLMSTSYNCKFTIRLQIMTGYDQVYINISISSYFHALCSWKVPSILFTRVGDFLRSLFLFMTLTILGLSCLVELLAESLSSSFFIMIFPQRYVAICYNMQRTLASLSFYPDALHPWRNEQNVYSSLLWFIFYSTYYIFLCIHQHPQTLCSK